MNSLEEIQKYIPEHTKEYERTIREIGWDEDVIFGALNGFHHGRRSMEREVDIINKKVKTVLNYIKTSEGDLTQYMWAATIIAVLLDCDFRDSKQNLDKWYEETR